MERKPGRLGLPPEIIYEILSNLPVKPLARFRCVSKLWNSLISDSSFQHEHYRRRLQQDPVLLIVSTYSDSVDHDTHPDTLDLSTYDANDRTDITNFTIPFPVPPSSFSCGSIQICRGLACVALETDVFVCNPATREIIALPSFGEEPSHCVGFGYAPSTNQFKVVSFFRNTLSRRTKNCCEIFTLGTSQWREARCPPPDSFSDLSFHAPFLHGAIHFLSDSRTHSANDAIYAFDIEGERYKTIPFPEDYYYAEEAAASPEWSGQCLNELRGSLCMTSNFETSMQLWLLKDYHSGKWVKEYTIVLPEFNYEFVWGEPLAIMGDGTILLNINWEQGSRDLYWYHPGNRTFEETLMEDYTATMYVESLLPLINKFVGKKKMERKPERLGLPPEIIYEILSNLPVKTLARFRCVSKLWNSLISDSSFQHEHYRRRLQQDPVLLIVNYGYYSVSVDHDTHPDTLDLSTYDSNDLTDITNFTIPFPVRPSSFPCFSIQICRGLACVAFETDVFLCNPATREIIALPSFGEEPSHCVGFGYAPSTNQFKVIRFFRNPLSRRTKNCCEIFTLGTSQWREARCPPPDSFSDLSFHAPFLHGAIHFLSDSRTHSANDAIYAFDIDGEGYKTIPFPEDYYFAEEAAASPEWSGQCLNELRGSLCMTSNFETSMQLWLLKDYHSGKWVKEYIIVLPEFNYEFVWGEPLAIMGDGTILLNINWEQGSRDLYWYHPGNRTFEETLMEDYTATMYVESLLPLAF